MTNQKAVEAFIARKAHIDAMLARLTELSNDHFNVSPEEIHWGHVGDVARIADQLKNITDIAFNEGEYA